MIGPEPIPADDILDAYLAADEDTRGTVSNILLSGNHYVSSSYAGATPSDIPIANVAWKGDPDMTMFLMMSLISFATKQFGEVWLKSLVRQISQ